MTRLCGLWSVLCLSVVTWVVAAIVLRALWEVLG